MFARAKITTKSATKKREQPFIKTAIAKKTGKWRGGARGLKIGALKPSGAMA
jgi:hypothetical protein